MRKRVVQIIRAIAIGAGVFAGFVGGVHGYYEISHGSVIPNGFFYDAVSGKALAVNSANWTGWPAMTIVPNFLVTGVLAVIIAVIVIAWSVLRVNRGNGGFFLIILSFALCFFGGGFVPPLIGAIGGIIGITGSIIERRI